MPNFIVLAKTWIINKLQLDISLNDIILSALHNGSLLRVDEHFQTMNELQNVYVYKITPTIGTNEFYPRYIPRLSLHEKLPWYRLKKLKIMLQKSPILL